MAKRSFFALLLLLVAILGSTYASGIAPESSEQLPPGVTIVGGQEPIPTASTEQFFPGGAFYRHRFMFPFGGSFRYGWRYPIGYWNSFGSAIYGPRCLFGRPFGSFFYC